MKSWTKGDRASQAAYGPGTVIEADTERIVIDFDEHGRKVFASQPSCEVGTDRRPFPSQRPSTLDAESSLANIRIEHHASRLRKYQSSDRDSSNEPVRQSSRSACL